MPNIARKIARLAEQSLAELRQSWTTYCPQMLMPHLLGRDLVARGIAWQLQVAQHGDLSPVELRQINRMASKLTRSGDLDLNRERRLKAGTMLVRIWHGKAYHVLVLRDGYLFEGHTYISLSQVASAITGTKRAGSHFFRLTKKAGDAK